MSAADELESLRLRVQELEQSEAQQRRAAEVLRRLTARLTDTIEQLPLVTFASAAEEDFDLSYVSEGVRELTGHRPDELVGSPGIWIERMHPEDRPRMLATLRRVAGGDREGSQRYRWLAADGRWLWIEASVKSLRSGRGGLLGTWRAAAAQDPLAADGEDGHAPLAAELPVAAYVCRASGNFDTLWISPEVESLTGYGPRRFTEDGLFWIDRIHPHDRPAVLAGFAELFERDRIRYSYRWRTRRGRWLPILDEVRLLRDGQGRPLRVLGVMVALDPVAPAHGRRRLQRLASRLADKAESRFGTLAQTLREDTGQRLVAARLHLETLRRSLDGAPAHVEAALEQVGELLAGALDQVQEVATVLRPSALDDVGLQAVLEDELARLAQRGVTTRLSVRGDVRSVDRTAATLAFRVVQALLTRSTAREALVQLAVRRTFLVLRTRLTDEDGAVPPGLPADLRARVLQAGGRLADRGGTGGASVLLLPLHPPGAPPWSACAPGC